jgi:hypothetical protein
MAVDTNYRAGIKLQFKNEWATFAATFARFEHALKQSGYLKHTKPGTSAEAGWDGFANDLGEDFLTLCRDLPETATLLQHPPRLLKVDRDESVSWKKPRAIVTVRDLFQVARDVRNNLFHGERQVHSDRDGELINAAQFLLDNAWDRALGLPENPKLVRFVTAFRFMLQ